MKKEFCSYCDKTGIIHDPINEKTVGDPILPCPKCVLPVCRCGGEDPYYYELDGRVVECECREVRLRIERIHRLYKTSGIDKKYQWRFMNSFESVNKLSQEAKKAAYEIVVKYPDVNRGIFLWGNPGTGKTLLSSIILTELMLRHNIDGKLIKISRTFFKRLKDTFVEGSATYGEASKIEREFEDADVLVIDDFGVQRDSPWEQETLYNLVDSRYEAERFTIFTSNQNPHKAFGELSHGRILSRIKEMCRIIEITGDDYRDRFQKND